MTCDWWWFWLLLLWTNLSYYLNYWVSLGRFCLLDIHCDYPLISPLCGVAQTPNCGMLVISFTYKPFMWCRTDAWLWHVCYFKLFISLLCGVAQTPDWGMLYIIILSRRRFRHPIGAFYFYSLIAYSCFIWTTCMLASWILFILWLTLWS